MTFATWSQTAASNTSVGGISTDGTVTLVKQIDNMFRGMMAELAVARDDGTIDAVGPRGYINGLILSNNSGDATNDIDISAGECTSADSPYWRMALASTLTKRLDAAWAVGSGNGGLDTGSIANTTYHVWLIQRSDTLVVDALFSASATSPTMPANYDRKSYVGPIIRASAAILPFTQINDTYYLTAGILDYASASAQNNVLQQFVSIPTGIRVQPLLSWSITATTANITNLIGSGESPTAAFGMHNLVATGTTIGSLNSLAGGIYSNTSGQLRLRVVITSGTITTNNITTLGWIHDRGRSS